VSNEKAFGPSNVFWNRTADAAIFYLTKNGIIWRDLPDGFPPWQTVYWYFRKWSKDETWVLIANELTMLHRLRVDKKPVPTVAIIDSQSVKNSSTATEQIGFDGGKRIKGRKRFLMVDTMGHLLWTDVRPANVHDGQAGVTFWEQAVGRCRRTSQSVAGRSGVDVCRQYIRWPF